MSKSTNVIIFAAGAAVGAAIGALATQQVLKSKYEKMADTEINSMKQYYISKSQRQNEKAAEESSDKEETDERDYQIKEGFEGRSRQPDIFEYASHLKEGDYINYGSDEIEPDRFYSKADGRKPYVISPSEFGEMDDYETISLIFYADSVLADEDDEIVDDIENTVGADSLRHFGEYEDDSVFVRNDRARCDYEILLSDRLYSDVIKSRHHLQMEER